jgi:transposase InsO family protein
VSRVLKRLGLNKLSALEPAKPVLRYEREHPGELIHIDIKKLGKFNHVGHRITGDRGHRHSRGIGWEFVHVAIDDASRIAFSKVMKNERQSCAIAFLRAAVAYYASLGVKVERVMTDNGPCYKAFAFRKACKRLGLRHIRTRPLRHRPMARPNASSRQACANGPTLEPINLHANAPQNSLTGCTAIIGTGLMAVSDQCHPSADSASPGTTC